MIKHAKSYLESNQPAEEVPSPENGLIQVNDVLIRINEVLEQADPVRIGLHTQGINRSNEAILQENEAIRQKVEELQAQLAECKNRDAARSLEGQQPVEPKASDKSSNSNAVDEA